MTFKPEQKRVESREVSCLKMLEGWGTLGSFVNIVGTCKLATESVPPFDCQFRSREPVGFGMRKAGATKAFCWCLLGRGARGVEQRSASTK